MLCLVNIFGDFYLMDKKILTKKANCSIIKTEKISDLKREEKMDLVQYITQMKALGTPVATASVVLLCLFLVVIIFKMLGGMRRGTWKQILRTGLTLAAAIISYIIAVIVSNSIMGSTDKGSIEDFITLLDNSFPGVGEFLTQALSSFDPEVFEYVIILPAAVVLLPILSTVIFLLINLLLKFVRSILLKLFGFKAAKTNTQRLGGALLGAVEAIIWIIMVTLPITGLVGIVNSACDEVLSSDRAEDESFATTYEEYIMPFTENPAFSFMDSLGVQTLADGIATITIDGEVTNLRDELLSVANIGLIEIPALEDADFGALTAENKLSLDNIVDALGRSPFISSVIAGVVQSSSGLMNSDFIPLDKAGDYGPFLASLVDFLEGVSRETLQNDVNTIKAVYYAISDSRVIKEIEKTEGADLMALLQEKQKDGDDTLLEIVTILQSNERTAPIIKAMTQALLSALSTDIQMPDGSTVTVSYDTLKDDMKDVLSVDRDNYQSDDEYMDALSMALDTTLRDNGIEIDDEIVDSIAEYIDSEYSSVTELTDEQFNDILLNYYDAYLEYVES